MVKQTKYFCDICKEEIYDSGNVLTHRVGFKTEKYNFVVEIIMDVHNRERKFGATYFGMEVMCLKCFKTLIAQGEMNLNL